MIGMGAGLLLVGATHGPVPPRAWNVITPDGVLKHIRVLASDEFEGRGVATPAEEKAVDYISTACRAMRLGPGNPDGSYVQKVALWGITSDGGEVVIKAADATFPLVAEDYTVSSAQPVAKIGIPESQMVFVGYGIVAPARLRVDVPARCDAVWRRDPSDRRAARQLCIVRRAPAIGY